MPLATAPATPPPEELLPAWTDPPEAEALPADELLPVEGELADEELLPREKSGKPEEALLELDCAPGEEPDGIEGEDGIGEDAPPLDDDELDEDELDDDELLLDDEGICGMLLDDCCVCCVLSQAPSNMAAIPRPRTILLRDMFISTDFKRQAQCNECIVYRPVYREIVTLQAIITFRPRQIRHHRSRCLTAV